MYYGIRAFYYFFLITFFLPTNGKSQTSSMFGKLTVENGLSQSTINHILQDRLGFIWFATNGGLNKFDGSKFITYQYSKSDTSTISNNIVHHLYEDQNNKIWISTQNGLNIYDRNTEDFHLIKLGQNGLSSVATNHITCVIEDDLGNFWIGTNGSGLYKYQPSNGKAVALRHDPNDPNSLPSNFITCIAKDFQGNIWIGTADAGLSKLNPQNNDSWRISTNDIHRTSSLSNDQINALYVDRHGDVWVGTSSGLDLIVTAKTRRFLNNPDSVIRYHQTAQSRHSIAGKNIQSIYQDKSDIIWFGTLDSGLGYTDKSIKKSGKFTADPNSEYALLSNRITVILEDNYGMLWIGTPAGINTLDKHQNRINWHKRISGTGNTISSNNIQAIVKEPNDILWLGSHDQGLTRYDPVLGIYTNYRDNDYLVEGESIRERNRLYRTFDQRKNTTPQEPVYYISHNRVNALVKDHLGRLWIGTANGLDVLQTQTGNITRFRNNPNDEFSLSSNNIQCLFIDSKRRIWIGTDDAGINLFENGKFIRFQSDMHDIFSLSGNSIRCFEEDEDGFLWIGTFGNGLNKFDVEKNKSIRFFHLESNSNSISGNTIYSLLVDGDNLWIGTSEGLDLLDRKKNSFQHIQTSSTGSITSINGLADDGAGSLWASTNHGLVQLDKKNQKVRNYGKEDGLQSTEFNPGAIYKTNSNELLFGSVNGYCSFYPHQINQTPINPDIVFTDFKILNERVSIGTPASPLKRSISLTDTVYLTINDISISFEFAALNFSNPAQTKYAYMMENFDERWNYVGNRRFANYTNLAPGTYFFRVKATNSDGEWMNDGKTLTIIINPPYWETWWFYSLLIIFITGTVLLIIQTRTKALHRSNVRLEEKVKRRTIQIKEQNRSLEMANKEILHQKNEIEHQNTLLKHKHEEISKAKTDLDDINKELLKINVNLENIVEERTHSLKLANDELMNANKELDMFIYRASHDLKGPIARLLGMTLLAKMDNKDEVLKEYISLIERGALDINKILNKLNNIHFINRPNLLTEDIDFDKLVNESRPNLENYIEPENLKIRLISEPNFHLRSDYILMKIIIENLLENAVIFRKTRTTEIELELRTDRKFIYISVADHGLGIPKDQYNRIFDMFFRGSERSKGNGLGLYLVRKAVQKLQGEIQVESMEGKFTCFTITLPKIMVPAELKSLVT